MATKPPLMQAAKGKAPAFKRPDLSAFIPAGQEDAVARLVAAGMKVMYSPDMKDEVMAAVQSDQPPGQKLGENAAGIMLTLMEQAQGKVPPEAIFPAAAELMSECAEMLVAAGHPVSQEDWKDGFFMLIGILGRKLGGTDEQIMGEMGKHVQGGGEPADEGEAEDEGEGEDEAPGMPEESGEAPEPEEEQERMA